MKVIYIFTNSAMPGLVKIGITSNVKKRLKDLYQTGVPVPFECEFAGEIESADDVEKAFHKAFDPQRLNSNREFFQIEPEQAIALLKLMITKDVTPYLQKAANKVDPESGEAIIKLKEAEKKRRRPNFKFKEMGIPIGSALNFTESEKNIEVISGNKVFFNGKETSLSAATRELLNRPNVGTGTTTYWKFKGKLLCDIYNETYPAP